MSTKRFLVRAAVVLVALILVALALPDTRLLIRVVAMLIVEGAP